MGEVHFGINLEFVHLHAKDISDEQSSAERGKVTGTPVGCACGDGVVDWPSVIEICRKAKRDIVLSVECGTVEQAGRSIEHLQLNLGSRPSRAGQLFSGALVHRRDGKSAEIF